MQDKSTVKGSKDRLINKILLFKEAGILFSLILICVITTIINPIFATPDNIVNILRSVSITLIGAIGMTFVLILGALDLSVGSVLALGGMVSGYFMSILGVPFPIAILLGILAGVLAGLFNGVIVTRFGIPPLIVTLGMMNIARGIVNVMSKGRPYSGFPDSFNSIGQDELFGIPYTVYIALVITIVAHFLLKHTVFGRSVMAIGGNEETARVSGINITKIKTLTYILVSTLAALAGILMASRLSTSQANAGTGWEMTVIASSVIGGTSTFGGSGSIIGTVIGVAIMEVLTVAMTMMRIDPYWQKIVVGGIIILAVGIDTYRRKSFSGSRG